MSETDDCETPARKAIVMNVIPWIYMILIDAGSLAAFTCLICRGHPFAAAVPAIALLTFEVKRRPTRQAFVNAVLAIWSESVQKVPELQGEYEIASEWLKKTWTTSELSKYFEP
jgi:hypothetical protein